MPDLSSADVGGGDAARRTLRQYHVAECVEKLIVGATPVSLRPYLALVTSLLTLVRLAALSSASAAALRGAHMDRARAELVMSRLRHWLAF